MKLYTCIIFFNPISGIQPKKYRNINNPKKFARFAGAIGGIYFNVYLKENRRFQERIYIATVI